MTLGGSKSTFLSVIDILKTFTILFVDELKRTAGIVVIQYDGENLPKIIRHAHENRDYFQAHLLKDDGFDPNPFYMRGRGQLDDEVRCAIDVLFRKHLVW